MRSIFLRPNSPRGRIEYVAKSMPNVVYDTAYVVAHTLGIDRDAIVYAVDQGAPLPVDLFRADVSHPHEAMIGWVAQQLAASKRAIRKKMAPEESYKALVMRLEAHLPQIALWAERTKPNLSTVTVSDAIEASSGFVDTDLQEQVPQGKVIYRFDNGWTVQELTEPEQIYAEGLAVQNCLRSGANGEIFAERVKEGSSRIFSLRSPEGRPHVSMEFVTPSRVVTSYFQQIYAKQNARLGATLKELVKSHNNPAALWSAIQKYKPLIQEFIVKKFDGDASGMILADLPLLPDTKVLNGSSIHLDNYSYPLPEGLQDIRVRRLSLRNYGFPLPVSIKTISSLDLSGYLHPIRHRLKYVRQLTVRAYDLPLPPIDEVGELMLDSRYKYPIDAIQNIALSFNFSPQGRRDWETKSKYQFPIPPHVDISSLQSLDLEAYAYPLPEDLEYTTATLNLGGYEHPLPPGLKKVGGLVLGGYQLHLPNLEEVEHDLDLSGYMLPLPNSLRHVGGKTLTHDPHREKCPYVFPLPKALFGSLAASPIPRARTKRRRSSLVRSSIGEETPDDVQTQFISKNRKLPDDLEVLHSEKVTLTGYEHKLPPNLKAITSSVILYGYNDPLPKSLQRVHGALDLSCYKYNLPDGLVADEVDVRNYEGQLPLSILLGSSLILGPKTRRLPNWIHTIHGRLRVEGYKHELPSALTTILGSVYAIKYDLELPTELRKVGGDLDLMGFGAQLPESFEEVGGDLILAGYGHPMPKSLRRVGGYVDLAEYNFPWPISVIPEKGFKNKDGYRFPLPKLPRELSENVRRRAHLTSRRKRTVTSKRTPKTSRRGPRLKGM